jgi:hypothetical protein
MKNSDGSVPSHGMTTVGSQTIRVGGPSKILDDQLLGKLGQTDSQCKIL